MHLRIVELTKLGANGKYISRGKGITKILDGTNGNGSRNHVAEWNYSIGGYQRNAAFLLSRKTFWQHVYPLRDDGKAQSLKKSRWLCNVRFPSIIQ